MGKELEKSGRGGGFVILPAEEGARNPGAPRSVPRGDQRSRPLHLELAVGHGQRPSPPPPDTQGSNLETWPGLKLC